MASKAGWPFLYYFMFCAHLFACTVWETHLASLIHMDLCALPIVLELCQRRLACQLIHAVLKTLCDLGKHGMQRNACSHTTGDFQGADSVGTNRSYNASKAWAPVESVHSGSCTVIKRLFGPITCLHYQLPCMDSGARSLWTIATCALRMPSRICTLGCGSGISM